MLVRKLKRGDCLIVGGIIITVVKSGEVNLGLAITAPDGVSINHAREGELCKVDTPDTKAPAC